jgi:hypothetical protein
MLTNSCTAWTCEDDGLIREFVKKNASALRASVALKRSRNVVVIRARKIGCPFPTLPRMRKKWADASNDSRQIR